MSDEVIRDLFSDSSYCRDEMMRIREAWGNQKTFNTKTIDASRWTLGLMLLYSPEKILDSVYSCLNELVTRESYLIFRRKYE